MFRAANGSWYILRSSTEFTAYTTYPWGLSSDIPVPNDYDGDGVTDLVVFRPSTGAWYVLNSSTNFTTYGSYVFGGSSDIPLPKRP